MHAGGSEDDESDGLLGGVSDDGRLKEVKRMEPKSIRGGDTEQILLGP